ncbi:hypothetical protein EIP91_010444 [Steccherinum ochraceum]|uniref:Zn(2)-C6 fungal-type domain-containing protein n=1 Tax=Steccherinum ochraceum TaxID=92696 RepID=A0A4R0R5W5_9APHY|nr:hypothetical protein EIP91_010444 [Steccherinum ochraceum]
MDPLSPVSQLTPPAMDQSKASKQPIIRGARACTVCRAAKMKCVGADDGDPCQRCRKSGAECVFEKHRRGRKPGSKLSEASKMLRRLEKGLNNAKLKSQSHETTFAQLTHDPRIFPSSELVPVNLPPRFEGGPHPHPSADGSDREEEDTDDSDKGSGGLFPAQLIKKENQRNSFFKTILNPENTDPHVVPGASGSTSSAPPQNLASPADSNGHYGGLKDPIAAGIITEDQANIFFDAFFLRLNPFINLFDPALHYTP